MCTLYIHVFVIYVATPYLRQPFFWSGEGCHNDHTIFFFRDETHIALLQYCFIICKFLTVFDRFGFFMIVVINKRHKRSKFIYVNQYQVAINQKIYESF